MAGCGFAQLEGSCDELAQVTEQIRAFLGIGDVAPVNQSIKLPLFKQQHVGSRRLEDCCRHFSNNLNKYKKMNVLFYFHSCCRPRVVVIVATESSAAEHEAMDMRINSSEAIVHGQKKGLMPSLGLGVTSVGRA